MVCKNMKKVIKMLLFSAAFCFGISTNIFASESAYVEEESISAEELKVLHSGTTNNIDWIIYDSGVLTLSGSGNYETDYKPEDDFYSYPAWTQYADEITSAQVSISEPTRTDGMFANCTKLETVSFENSSFDDKIISTERMFAGCSKLKSVDLSNYTFPKLSQTNHMFDGCEALETINMKKWDTEKLYQAKDMFSGCESLTTITIDHFTAGGLCYTDRMFSDCKALETLPLSEFAPVKLYTMDGMFANCEAVKSIDLKYVDLQYTGSMYQCFSGCSNLETITYKEGTTTDSLVDIRGLFKGCKSMEQINLTPYKTDKVESFSSVFEGCESLVTIDLSSLSTGNSEWFDYLFSGCKNLKSINLSGINTEKATTLNSMFEGCASLTNINLKPLKTGNVRSFDSMFEGCTGLKSVDVSPLNTKNAVSFIEVFKNCSNLTTMDLSVLNLSNVTSFEGVFENCIALTQVKLQGIDTGMVESFWGTFRNCKSLTAIDTAAIKTDKAKIMIFMFDGCEALTGLDLSSWNLGNLESATGMFEGCSKLTSVKFGTGNYDKIEYMGSMFENCSALTSVDLSSFDVKKITEPSRVMSGDELFTECNSLTQIKSPRNMKVCFMFPYETGKKWYAESGTEAPYGTAAQLNGLKDKQYMLMDQTASVTYYREDALPTTVQQKAKENQTQSELTVGETISAASLTASGGTLPEDATFIITTTEDGKRALLFCGVSQWDAKEVKLPEKIYYKGTELPVIGVAPISFGIVKSNLEFNVTDGMAQIPTVSITKLVNAKKASKTLTLPAYVTHCGIRYKVTGIAEKAFINNKKITKAVVPDTVEVISDSAFEGCKKLKEMRIGKGTTTIGAKAFSGCGKLRTIKITSTKLTKVSANALKNVTNCKIVVPKKKLSKYKKLFQKKGQKKSVKITK